MIPFENQEAIARREVVIDEATYLHNGKPFVRTVESSEKGK